ncbi:MAG TPA: CBS domain-containing protein [Actinomycetota bacterium]
MEAVHVQAAVEEALGPVESIMEPNVVTLRPDHPLEDAIRRLEQAGVSGAPVVEDGLVVGMVSLAELFEEAGVAVRLTLTTGPWLRYEHKAAKSKGTVAAAMNQAVVALGLTASVAEAAAVMLDRGVNRIPIVDDNGALRGIVARDDVLRAVAKLHRSPRASAPYPALVPDREVVLRPCARATS